MATKKRKLDPNVDVPTCKSDIDKYYVVAYTKAHGTPEQRAAVKAAIKSNTVEKISNFTKKPYSDVKMKEVREVFCGFFFPHLNAKKVKDDFDSLVDEL